MLTSGVTIPADGHPRLVEPKWDGVRAIVVVRDGAVRLSSRNANDITAAYPELATPPPPLAGRGAVLDAEIVAFGPQGRPDFGLLQRRMHVRGPSPRLVAEVPVTAVVFDLLWIDGRLVIDEPQQRRRARLDQLGIAGAPWLTSPVLDLDPHHDLVGMGRDLGLEGFVVKRADAPYTPGRRSDSWIKVKCLRRREFVVGGWLEGKRSRAGDLGSLALGVWAGDPRRLVFVGMVGSGLSATDISAFRGALEDLARTDSPFAGATPPGLRFLDPVLVAEVTFSEVTAAGTLRHPVLAGFRTDLAADDVGFDAELPQPPGALPEPR